MALSIEQIKKILKDNNLSDFIFMGIDKDSDRFTVLAHNDDPIRICNIMMEATAAIAYNNNLILVEENGEKYFSKTGS